MKKDLQIIINEKLYNDEWIDKKQFCLLQHDGENTIDNTECNWDLVGNDVYLYGQGSYPLILKDYANTNN